MLRHKRDKAFTPDGLDLEAAFSLAKFEMMMVFCFVFFSVDIKYQFLGKRNKMLAFHIHPKNNGA